MVVDKDGKEEETRSCLFIKFLLQLAVDSNLNENHLWDAAQLQHDYKSLSLSYSSLQTRGVQLRNALPRNTFSLLLK